MSEETHPIPDHKLTANLALIWGDRYGRKTGNRLKQQNIDSETSEAVSREDIARGYEIAKGQHVIVEDERE